MFKLLRTSTVVIILAVTVTICGCGKFSRPPVAQDLKPPIEIEIPQSFVTENILHVKVSLKPLVNLRPEQVAIELIGISKGVESSEKTVLLSDLVTEPLLIGGDTFVSDFEIDARELEEYKVVCKWNEDKIVIGNQTSNQPLGQTQNASAEIASKLNVQPKESIALSILEQSLIRSECLKGKDSCERNFTVDAKLKNSSAEDISEISLALEIQFVEATPDVASKNKITEDLLPLKS